MNAPKLRVVHSRDEVAALEPGELLVRILRDGWTIAPDFVAIAKANWTLRNWRSEGRAT